MQDYLALYICRFLHSNKHILLSQVQSSAGVVYDGYLNIT